MYFFLVVFFFLFIIHLNFDQYSFQNMTKLFIYKNLTLWHCQYWGYPLFCNQLISRWPNIINKLLALSVLCVINIYNKFGHFKLVLKKHLKCHKVRCSIDLRRSPRVAVLARGELLLLLVLGHGHLSFVTNWVFFSFLTIKVFF